MNAWIRCLPRSFAAALILAVAGALRLTAATDAPAAARKVREPAVAGLFYPKDPAALAKMIDTCLAAARTTPLPGELRALVCPHAGYPYSGPVAAFAYKLLTSRSYDTVVVMGPSHYADLGSASVTNADLYRTALGDVAISPKARALAKLSPFALEPHCLLQRPNWWHESSRPPPDVDTADTWEHSVEVEVPFLQRTLKDFQLVPVVFGEVSPLKAARALLQVVDDRTLLIASSDLSHYHPYAEARQLDTNTVENICRLDASAIADDDACGHTPIRTLIYIAKEKGWKARLLDYRNSGDTTGDKARGVVGYAAIAFYAPDASAQETAPAPAAVPAGQFSKADRKFLLELARRTVRTVAAGGDLPQVPDDGLNPLLKADRGCFVTLTIHGELRGCIGNIGPQGPLYERVLENARSAALHDPRFPAVTPREVDRIEIEVSVLTEPKRLAFDSPEDLVAKLQPGIDGVVLQIGRHMSTYLPQVWEQLPDKVDFLNQLAEKGGGAPSDWRKPGTTVYIYHVESFKESDFASPGAG